MTYHFNKVVLLSDELKFPSPLIASDEGLLAVGGDLSSDRLLLAYRSGIFPWYNVNDPILWWSPNPRMVLFLDNLKVSKSLKKKLKSKKYKVSFNKAFEDVAINCATSERKGESGTWIGNEMIEAYIRLHELGNALSVEVWNQGGLVGGLYGVDLPEKKIFCGESMFSLESDTSKIALFHLVDHLRQKSYKLIDCQIYSAHLERLGAEEIPRERFINFLK